MTPMQNMLHLVRDAIVYLAKGFFARRRSSRADDFFAGVTIERAQRSAKRANRLSHYAALIDRGGGVQAIGGHLILVVSDEPPPNKTHVVYIPLREATPELILLTVDEAVRT